MLSLGDARLLLPVSQPSLTFRDDFLEADMRKAFMTFTGDVTSQGIGIMLATHGTLGALDLYVSLKYAPEGLDFVVSLCGGIVVCCFLQLLCATKGTAARYIAGSGGICAKIPPKKTGPGLGGARLRALRARTLGGAGPNICID